MKTKVISVLLVVLMIFSVTAPAAFAEDGFVLTLDDEERYTNIIEASDNQERTYFDIEKSSTAMTKTTYIIILSVLLVISIIVLIVTLHKQKKLNAEDEAEQDEISEQGEISVPADDETSESEQKGDTGKADNSNKNLK